MGFKYSKGKLTYKKKGMMNGYIPEPGMEAKEKCNSYIDKAKKKKRLL